VGKAASTLGGVVAVGTGYLGGHLSFVLGAGGGERGRLSAALALPEHTETQPATPAVADLVSGDGRPGTSGAEVAAGPRQSAPGVRPAPTARRASATGSWPIVEVVTPAVTDDQQRALQELPHFMAENGSKRLQPTSDEVHTAFRFSPDEVTLESLRALCAEASVIAGAARLVCREGDPDVMRLVEETNAS
jgi:hypothetical protein